MKLLQKIIIVLCIYPTFSFAMQKVHISPKKVVVACCLDCIPFEKRELGVDLARSSNFVFKLHSGDQRNPGRSILSTVKHINSLSEWPEQYWLEFGKFEKAIEIALKKSFGAKLINVECKMNLAGQEGTHTHFHILPRYDKEISLSDPKTGTELIFKDEFWGKPFDFTQSDYRKISPEFLWYIATRIKNSLDISKLPEGQMHND